MVWVLRPGVGLLRALMQIVEVIAIAEVIADRGGGNIVSRDDEIGNGDIAAGIHAGNAARGEVFCDRFLNHGVDGLAIVQETGNWLGTGFDEVEGARVNCALVDFGTSSGGITGCQSNQNEQEK